MKVKGSAILKAVEAANAVRSDFGLKPIDDLPRGYKKIPESCVLAEAFNFNCQVNGGRFEGWHVYFKQIKHAEVLASSLGRKVKLNKNKGNDQHKKYFPYKVKLPRNIAKIAMAFDRGQLPHYERF